MKIQSLFLLIILWFCGSYNLHAGTIGSFQFLKLPSHAQESSLAGASLTTAEGSGSLFVNPANLSISREVELAASYNAWILQMPYFSASMAIPFKIGSLGIGGTMLSSGKQDVIENFQVVDEQVNSDFSVIVGYGADIGKGISAGGSLKFVSGNLLDERINLGLLDLAINLSPLKALDFAVCVKNLGFSSLSLPLNIQTGISYSIRKKDFRLIPILSADYQSDSASGIALALAADYRETITLRMGFNHKWGDSNLFMNDGFRIGAGVKWKEISCDVGLTPMGPFGQTAMVSIGFRK